MGSCLSKKEREKWKAPSSSHSCCRDPPPDSPQEEKVKEVLSETPNPNTKLTSPRASRDKEKEEEEIINNNNEKEKEKEEEEEKEKLEEEKKKKDDGGFQDRSEDTSEVHSVSETLSVSTPVPETEKKKKIKNVEELERRVDRSPARHQRKRSVSGELHPSPARKISDEQRRGVGCRSRGRSSSPSPNSVGRTHSARETVRVSAFRRDHGEISEAASGGKCRSVSRADGRCSPHRIQARIPAADVPANDDEAVPGTTESLENPLVSLECFIFL